MSESKEDKPIPGPEHVGPEYLSSREYSAPPSPALTAGRFVMDLIRKPAEWVRENIVEPNRGPKYYWYHRKFNRALPIDECYIDDSACIFEANMEYRRNQLVDRLALDLIRMRKDNCHFWWLTTKAQHQAAEECEGIEEIFNREQDNFFIKYGDLHFGSTVIHAYNKQKHRMIMERRRAIAEKERLKELEMVSETS